MAVIGALSGYCKRCCQILRRRTFTLFASLKTTVGKRFLILYAATFLLILPVLFHGVNNSIYCMKTDFAGNEAKERMIRENTQRLRFAEDYFSFLNRSHGMRNWFSGNDTAVSSERQLHVAIIIITVSRNRHKVDLYEPRYLTQVVWKFLSQLDVARANSYPHRMSLAVCNVDHIPGSYEEAKNVAQFIRTFNRFSYTHFSMVHPLEKEKQDYVFCLNASLADRPDYVMLVEDDALPNDDFLGVLRHTIDTRLERRLVHGALHHPSDKNIAYVKFYHPERLLSFLSLERDRIPELIAFATILATLLNIVYVIVFRTGSFRVVWMNLFIYSLLVAATIGRSNLSELRRFLSPNFYIFTPAPSCCTPALLFPFSGAIQVCDYLSAATCDRNYGKDSILDQMLIERHMLAYLVQPNTFTHIGLYSAIRERIVDPFLV